MPSIDENIQNDREYRKIVNSILINDEFNKLKDMEHHGITRYEHSLKVSYYAYKVAKALKLDYSKVARGGLLHDFFLSRDDRTTKDKLVSAFTHPKMAEQNARELFYITEKEANMIRSHMFPINIAVPRYFESWVVNIVDKTIAIKELGYKFSKQLKHATNLYLLLLVNIISNI